MFKNPNCAAAAQACKVGELQLSVLAPLSCITQEVGASHVWVGKLGEGSGSTHVWLKPILKLPEENDDGFIVPAWFVDTTKDPNIANMTVSWKELYGIHVPVMSNTIALKPGDRLYRLVKCKKGTAPPSVITYLTKKEKKEQEEKEKGEDVEKKGGE